MSQPQRKVATPGTSQPWHSTTPCRRRCRSRRCGLASSSTGLPTVRASFSSPRLPVAEPHRIAGEREDLDVPVTVKQPLERPGVLVNNTVAGMKHGLPVVLVDSAGRRLSRPGEGRCQPRRSAAGCGGALARTARRRDRDRPAAGPVLRPSPRRGSRCLALVPDDGGRSDHQVDRCGRSAQRCGGRCGGVVRTCLRSCAGTRLGGLDGTPSPARGSYELPPIRAGDRGVRRAACGGSRDGPLVRSPNADHL